MTSERRDASSNDAVEPILRHSPMWSIAIGSFAFAFALNGLGVAVADGAEAWIAAFLITSATLALAGLLYGFFSLRSLRARMSATVLGLAAVLLNLGALLLAIAIAAVVRW
jgi:hypothetical protein